MISAGPTAGPASSPSKFDSQCSIVSLSCFKEGYNRSLALSVSAPSAPPEPFRLALGLHSTNGQDDVRVTQQRGFNPQSPHLAGFPIVVEHTAIHVRLG